MKYNIFINQLALSEMKLKKFDITDAAILDFLIHFCKSEDQKIDRISSKEGNNIYTYTWVSYSKVLQELPLLKINQLESVRTRINRLVAAGFIKKLIRKDGNLGTKIYIRLTDKIDLLFFYPPQSRLDTTPIQIVKPPQSKLIDNITNNNITNDNNIRTCTKIFSLYKERIQKGAKYTPPVKDKITTRLKVYSLDDLSKAIDNFSKNAWWMENNAHRGPMWFFSSDARIDQFLYIKPEQDAGVINFK